MGAGTAVKAAVAAIAPRSMLAMFLVAACVVPVFLPDAVLSILGWGGNAGTHGAGETVIRWLLSLMPNAVILHHALFLVYLRRQQFPDFRAALVGTPGPTTSLATLKEVYFGNASIVVRYAVPMILASALCSTAILTLTNDSLFATWLARANPARLHRAASVGFAGAYLYVAMLLTQRAFRRDITPGVALWTAAMFVVGPLMAGVFAMFWSPAADAGTFGPDVVYLAAGMLPRQFADIAQGMARRLLQAQPTAAQSRLVPLTSVRGINDVIEERLNEEGIYDVSTLAYADPYLLLRNTSFDRRQLANWIDEALLMNSLPDAWEPLEKVGITGALDLARTLSGEPADSPSVKALVDATRMDATLLVDLGVRLNEDAQLADLYAIYWTPSDGEGPRVQEAAPPSGTVAPENRSLQPLVFSIADPLSADEQQQLLASLRQSGDFSTIEPMAPAGTYRAYVPAERMSQVRDRLRGTAHITMPVEH